MVVNAMIDVNGRRKSPILPSGARRTLTPVNLEGEALRQHARRMAAEMEAASAKKDMESAFLALNCANGEIDRLREEVERLNSELAAERERNERLAASQKTRQTRQKKEIPSEASSPAQES